MKTRVPIQNILLDLGATACLETPNNPNAWSCCCSLCRLLASTQHVMDHWSIKKNLHHRSSFFIFQSRKSNFNLEPQCRFRFLALGQGFKDDDINVEQISSGVRLEQWNLWNKTFLTCFLRQVQRFKQSQEYLSVINLKLIVLIFENVLIVFHHQSHVGNVQCNLQPLRLFLAE